MKVIYKCHYDGKVCDKEIPKLDEQGNVISPKEYNNPDIVCEGAWKTCMDCQRNHSISGTCYGILKIE